MRVVRLLFSFFMKVQISRSYCTWFEFCIWSTSCIWISNNGSKSVAISSYNGISKWKKKTLLLLVLRNTVGIWNPIIWNPDFLKVRFQMVWLYPWLKLYVRDAERPLHPHIVDSQSNWWKVGYAAPFVCIWASWFMICMSIFHPRADATFPLSPPFFFSHR